MCGRDGPPETYHTVKGLHRRMDGSLRRVNASVREKRASKETSGLTGQSMVLVGVPELNTSTALSMCLVLLKCSNHCTSISLPCKIFKLVTRVWFGTSQCQGPLCLLSHCSASFQMTAGAPGSMHRSSLQEQGRWKRESLVKALSRSGIYH